MRAMPGLVASIALITCFACAACKNGSQDPAAATASTADGAAPAPVMAISPRWNAERQGFPQNCDAAVSRLLGAMGPDLRAQLLEMPRSALPGLQDSLGTSVAGAFGLWENNPQLLVSCASSKPGTPADARAVSQLIIERAWDRLQSAVPHDD